MINFTIDRDYSELEKEILNIPERFENEGEILQKARNTIKKLQLGEFDINVKSFKVPHLVNKFAYKFIRDSKAKRSFKFAKKLQSMDIGTPSPIAYIEFMNRFGLTRSYYISIQQRCDLTFRDMLLQDIPDRDEILKAFTKFTYNLHSKGVFFIDHSPGNTLIKRVDGGYNFYLVDLNRTKFYDKEISVEAGIDNFNRLIATDEMVKIMAKEYASLRDLDEEQTYKTMLAATEKRKRDIA